MRYFLGILLLITGFGFPAQAQRILPTTGDPNSLNTFRGGVQIDSFFHSPTRDTGAWYGHYSDFIHQGGKLKYYDEGTHSYKAVGGSDAGFIHFSDTSTTIATKSYATQTLTLTGRKLSITRGDTVTVKDAELTQTITGATGSTFTLAQPVLSDKWIIVILNTATVNPVDFDVGGSTLQLHFSITANDHLQIYYKSP